MKKLLMLITAIAMMMVTFAFVAPAANATETFTEPKSCTDVNVGEGTGDCADVVVGKSHSASSVSSKVVAVNGIRLTSKTTVLARVKADGTPKAQQTNCWQIKKAKSLWTSYNRYGGTGWHWKSYPKGYRFCKIDGKTRDPICHNMVNLSRPKSRPPKNAVLGEVEFVKRLKFETKAVAKADEEVTSLAKAWCNTTYAYGYGEGGGNAAVYAVARASLKGYVLTKVLAEVSARANGGLEAQLDGKSVTQVKADVRASAFAEAQTDAWARAECKDKPVVVQPPPPPAENQKPSGEIVQFPAHLYVGGTYRAKVVGSDPEDGGNVTLAYSVTGQAEVVKNDPNYPEICDVEGTQRVCYFWIKAKASPGDATISLMVTDSRGVQSGDKPYTKTFPVLADEF